MTDTERLNWLEEMADGIAIVHDDGERWACVTSGFQPVPEDGGFKETVCMQSFVEPGEWFVNLRDAIDDCRRRIEAE